MNEKEEKQGNRLDQQAKHHKLTKLWVKPQPIQYGLVQASSLRSISFWIYGPVRDELAPDDAANKSWQKMMLRNEGRGTRIFSRMYAQYPRGIRARTWRCSLFHSKCIWIEISKWDGVQDEMTKKYGRSCIRRAIFIIQLNPALAHFKGLAKFMC